MPSHLCQPGLPFLLHSTSSATPLSDVTFTRSVRRWVRDHLHESPDDFSGHSFRRGGATAMQLAGVPESTIAAHERWKSLASRTYFDVQHSFSLRLAATAPSSPTAVDVIAPPSSYLVCLLLRRTSSPFLFGRSPRPLLIWWLLHRSWSVHTDRPVERLQRFIVQHRLSMHMPATRLSSLHQRSDEHTYRTDTQTRTFTH